jgi:hypothetical protein
MIMKFICLFLIADANMTKHKNIYKRMICLRPVSCVPNVASFSGGVSILDCPFVFSNVYSGKRGAGELCFLQDKDGVTNK